MAKRRTEDELIGMVEAQEPAAVDGSQTAGEPTANASNGPPAGDFVVLVNKSGHRLPCHLRSGRVVTLGPRIAGLNLHRSDPIRKNDRTPILFAWERRGLIAFEPWTGGDSQ